MAYTKKTHSRRKNRKAYFNAPSHVRRIIMSAPLSRDLRKKYNVRSLPVRKEDDVRVMSGSHKGREGKIICCYRKRWKIHIDKITREKANGTPVQVGIHPSSVLIIKLKLDRTRKKLLDKKRRFKKRDHLAAKEKKKAEKGGDKKVTQSDVAMQDVD
eukprot:NODE_1314_length_970_cov_388.252986_g1010_i0.p1 GENE.NODE_1314_length_970_cov_388.252986_g1010_i0~~NODE_1314_length_970_cov_388.252986_g1010_i0.p1  ORF type:complete len:157 (-),score=40.64 NODE_1314_length_970_cov_388.252986_g1010_i0:181-651(-)